ncbi:MAG: DUF7619 domain-containing protein [Chryseobacterium jejuense]|uniref:DUF7619 domain-containing protein n=1 Tax=Chryseobacterium jejuense TaxID=445960 RepID=UPI003D14DE18
MKKNLLVCFAVFSIFISAQTWTKLAGGEGYQGYFNSAGASHQGYSEGLNQFSSKNLPYFHEFSTSFRSDCVRWNVNNEFIYLYENRLGITSFWVLDTATKQWKKLNEVNSNTPNYGVKGVASSTNFPGPRSGTITWVDNNGNLWMYGNNDFPKQTDMWKYDPSTNMWTWISGTQTDSSSLPAQQGISSATALPKTYKDSYTWVDNQNNLWMFGGSKLITDYSSSNQVWKYNTSTNQWTWMKGADDTDYQNAANVLGSENVEDPVNTPGELYMYKGAFWQDNNSIYVLPALGQPILWKYNMLTNNWCFVKRPNDTSTFYSYGTMGTEISSNFPSAVEDPSFWKDNNGTFWMLGGEIKDPESHSTYVGRNALVNTLWKYNPATNNWTWMKGKSPLSYVQNVNSENLIPFSPGYYGNKDTADEKNLPGSRKRSIFWQKNNELYFANGFSLLNTNLLKYTDFWKYNTQSNNFTWIGGRTAASNDLEYIEDFTGASVYNIPRVSNYIFDGIKTVYAFREYKSNEIWAYDMVDGTWRLIKAEQPGNYGTVGVESPTNALHIPKGVWMKDGNIYILAGESLYNNTQSLWKFDTATKNYTCLKKGAYSPGIIDQPNTDNFPVANYEAANWINDNKLYTLGGGSSYSSLNEFWEYDFATNIWVRRESLPAPLHSMSFGKDSKNNVWIFGGSYGSDDAAGSSKKNNNVWKYDYAAKTWQQFQGGPGNVVGYYGTQNITANNVRPGTRSPLASWMDKYDRLWIYSGNGWAEDGGTDFYTRSLNDLWYYDTNQNKWFWVQGNRNNVSIFGLDNSFYDNTRFVHDMPKFENRVYPFVYNDKNYVFSATSSFGNKINALWKMDTDNIPAYNFVMGTASFDADNNACSTTDPKYKSLKIVAQSGSNSMTTFTDDLGKYKILLNQLNAVTLSATPEFPAYFNVTPSTANINFTVGNNTEYKDFCVTANGLHKDLEIKIIPLDQPRPGFETRYKIIYFNKGTATLSGSIQLEYPQNQVAYFTATATPDVTTTNTLTWNYVALQPLQQREIIVTFKVNIPTHPTYPVNSGDILPFKATVNPVNGDEIPEDNVHIIKDLVVNSLDPNDKQCLEGETIGTEMVGQYLHYLIRFENTGTGNAINVVLKDIIDTSKFEISTLQPISASHPYRVSITEGNKMEVSFENIQLPYPPSQDRHGYFLFKIKTKPNIAPGDQLKNKADIYFDYNSPVITNEYLTTVSQVLSTDEVKIHNAAIYPNPVVDILNIQFNEKIKSVEIYDANGRIVKTVIGSDAKIEVRDLIPGNYIIRINTEKSMYKTKFIKK